jgi:uncharacterized membrane protein YdjX (TVP38/TMEM64 family)
VSGRRLHVARLLGFVAFVATGLLIIALSGSLSVDRVREWGDGYGAAGPLVFIVISSLLTVVMFPGPILAGACGLLFGTAVGTPTAIVSATLGATLACVLARGVAREPVIELGGSRVTSVRDWVSRRGFTGVLLLRLMPGVPYNFVNYGVGLTHVPVGVFALATAIGTAPRTFAYVALGGQLGSIGSWQMIAALTVLVVFGAFGLALAARDPELRDGVRRLRPRRGAA